MKGSSGNSKQHRNAIRLWFENIGSRCAYCGVEMVPYEEAFKLNQRSSIKNRGKYTRAELRRANNHPTVDHVIPVVKGGSGRMKNYAICCERCNHDKDSKDHAGLCRDLKAAWFETIDRWIISRDGVPYPDPY